jgi:DNA gyrase subunit A
MMGRSAAGVAGFATDGSQVVGVALSHEGDTLLSVSENGYGKRSGFDSFRLTSRGKKGVTAIKITDKTGPLVSVQAVKGDEDAMIVASDGVMIRIHMNDVGIYSRNTQGIRLIHVNEGAHVIRLTLVPEQSEKSEEIQIEEGSEVVETVAVYENDQGQEGFDEVMSD